MFGFAGTSLRGPLRKAQELMCKAWDCDDPKKRAEMAERAVEICPDCADAYVLLGEEATDDLEEGIGIFRMGVEAGERGLGGKMLKENVGHFWGVLETRPSMRARINLAMCQWEDGKREEALGHYRELLRLNPNDNQGSVGCWRIPFSGAGSTRNSMPCWLTTRKTHPLSGAGRGACSRSGRRGGKGARLAGLLQEARKTNEHVPDYLLERRKIPGEKPAVMSCRRIEGDGVRRGRLRRLEVDPRRAEVARPRDAGGRGARSCGSKGEAVEAPDLTRLRRVARSFHLIRFRVIR